MLRTFRVVLAVLTCTVGIMLSSSGILLLSPAEYRRAVQGPTPDIGIAWLVVGVFLTLLPLMQLIARRPSVMRCLIQMERRELEGRYQRKLLANYRRMENWKAEKQAEIYAEILDQVDRGILGPGIPPRGPEDQE